MYKMEYLSSSDLTDTAASWRKIYSFLSKHLWHVILLHQLVINLPPTVAILHFGGVSVCDAIIRKTLQVALLNMTRSLLDNPRRKLIKGPCEVGWRAICIHVRIGTIMFRRGGPSKVSNAVRSTLRLPPRGDLTTQLVHYRGEYIRYVYKAGTFRKTLIAEIHHNATDQRLRSTRLKLYFNAPAGSIYNPDHAANSVSSFIIEDHNLGMPTNIWRFRIGFKDYELVKMLDNNYWSVRAVSCTISLLPSH